MRGAVEDESEQLAFTPAAIEAVDEFIQVPLEVLSAHPVKGPPEPSLEVAEDRVAPRQDLRRAGTIGALHLAIVANADLFETEVGGEAIRAHGGAGGVYGAFDKRAEIFLEAYSFEYGEPRPSRGVLPLLHSPSHDALVQHLSATSPTPFVGSDVRLVDLDQPGQTILGTGVQRRAELVERKRSAKCVADQRSLRTSRSMF